MAKGVISTAPSSKRLKVSMDVYSYIKENVGVGEDTGRAGIMSLVFSLYHFLNMTETPEKYDANFPSIPNI